MNNNKNIYLYIINTIKINKDIYILFGNNNTKYILLSYFFNKFKLLFLFLPFIDIIILNNEILVPMIINITINYTSLLFY